MKYKTIGAFKGVQNVGDCKATTELKVGMGVELDRAEKTASLPTDATTVHYIVTNINDKPELLLFEDEYIVFEGEYVRADDLTSIPNLEIEFGESEISDDYDDLAVGNYLVFGTDGLLTVAADASSYKVYFEITELTAYTGSGVLAVIRVN